jgi:hypothetical protein
MDSDIPNILMIKPLGSLNSNARNSNNIINIKQQSRAGEDSSSISYQPDRTENDPIIIRKNLFG